jgi:hypothetical protein
LSGEIGVASVCCFSVLRSRLRRRRGESRDVRNRKTARAQLCVCTAVRLTIRSLDLPGTDEVVSQVLAESAGPGVDAHAIRTGAVFAAVPRRPRVHPRVHFAEFAALAAFVGDIVGRNLRLEPARAELALGQTEHGRGGCEVDLIHVRVGTPHGFCRVRGGGCGAGELRACPSAEARAQGLERVRRRGHRGRGGWWRGIHDERGDEHGENADVKVTRVSHA